ncbi:hypothetical protein, partial [Stenotrophomonas maltophilia group sp. RNC7]|uniref:hypothetical protein n=1 Tax=Stenotrophomonas maltophilia group sp. RNC7 TaxID=3071467 RepID=UPI0027DF8D48
TISIKDIQGATHTKTFGFTTYAQEKPIAGFSLVGTGIRNDEGAATYQVTDSSKVTLNPIGKVQYLSEINEYAFNVDGTQKVIGTKRVLLETENMELKFGVGEHKIWQVV